VEEDHFDRKDLRIRRHSTQKVGELLPNVVSQKMLHLLPSANQCGAIYGIGLGATRSQTCAACTHSVQHTTHGLS
jgi:hypothetical protein